MSYFVLLVLHLFAAIIFAGAVFFEVLILESVGKQLGPDIRRTVELSVASRARRLMPFVIAVLFGAGISMAWSYRDMLAHPFASTFATLLWIKILLALSVLGHFITAVTLGAQGRLKSRHVHVVHISVFCHVIAIVLLAKAMFYLA